MLSHSGTGREVGSGGRFRCSRTDVFLHIFCTLLALFALCGVYDL